MVKNSPASVGDANLIPGSGMFPGEGNGNPLQSLPAESRGQSSLVGYSPWSCKESDRHDLATEQQRQSEASNCACHEVMGNITNCLFFFFLKKVVKTIPR